MTERLYKIAQASNRFAKIWQHRELAWAELTAMLLTPVRTRETMAEYKLLAKPTQTDIKDVGGFVGGHLKDGVRKNGQVTVRSLVALDFDEFDAAHLDRVKEALRGYAWVLHSTHKHTSSAWRVRLVIPLGRDVTCDEYGAISRKLGQKVGFDGIDRTTFEPVRMMFLPSVSKDGPYLFEASESDVPVDPDDILSEFHDWRDMTTWPMLPEEEAALGGGLLPGENRPRSAAELFARQGNGGRQEDPTEKKGLIGAFCRTYDIHAAIEAYLPDLYARASGNRYTHTGSSTSGGAWVLDEGKFLFSFHGTDPLQGRLLNSWDLVRLAKFGGADWKSGEDTRTARLPSSRLMEELARDDRRVRLTVMKEREAQNDAFVNINIDDSESSESSGNPDGLKAPVSYDEARWDEVRSGMDMDRKGRLESSIHQICLTLRLDPKLKDTVALDEFTRDINTVRPLPWQRPEDAKVWQDIDFEHLWNYLNKAYGFDGIQKITSAVKTIAAERGRHPVREYLRSLKWDGQERLKTIFTEVIGAEDTELNRALAELFCTAAVARVMEPGCKFDYFLVLKGPEGCGKSSFGEILGGQWFSDSFFSFDGKEGMESIAGNWLLEVPEMIGTKRAGAEAVKKFISSRTDKYRPAYGRIKETRPRQCVFYGTTNEDNFLAGIDTGNRRNPVVECRPELRKCGKSVRDWLHENRDQIWAEAHVHYLRLACEVAEGKHHELPLMLPPHLEAAAREQTKKYNRDLNNPNLGELDKFLDLWLPCDTGDDQIWNVDQPGGWESFTTEQRREWLQKNGIGNTYAGAAGYRQRTTVCMPEILQEYFGMKRTDKAYVSMSRDFGRYLNTKQDWTKVGSKRHPVYGVQMTWERVCNPKAANSDYKATENGTDF